MSDALRLAVLTQKSKASVVMDEVLKAALEAWATKKRRMSTICVR